MELNSDVSRAGISLWRPVAQGLTFFFPELTQQLKAEQYCPPLTPEAGRDAGAASSHRKTATFQLQCQADGPHSTNQQSWLVIPSAVVH